MIKELLKEAFILKSRGYYKHAIESFYKALEIDNTSSELLLEIADSYYKMGEIERALSYIEQVLDKNPVQLEALELLKQIFLCKKAWCEAEQTAKNIFCISNIPQDLAKIFELLNKQHRYREIFEYEISEFCPEILFEMAYAKLALNELVDAENYINQALNELVNNKILLLKGKILFRMNRKSECVELLKSLELDETDSEIMNFVGLVKQYECDYKKALENFKIAIKLEPDRDEYYYNCASTYFKMGDLQQAKKYYNLAILQVPDNQNYHFALANLYYSERNYKRALEELEFDFFEAKLLKSIILYDTGYLVLAKKELEKLYQDYPEDEILLDYKKRIEEELKI